MKRSLLVYAIIITVLLNACTKNTLRPEEVMIRVENATDTSFSSFRLNATAFGAIAKGESSSYMRCRQVLPVPFANAVYINGVSTYIVDIVPTPVLSSGNYLLKIESDTLPYRYSASFTKE